jgi:hypothetical protein
MSLKLAAGSNVARRGLCLPTVLEINLDVIPVIMTGGSLNLPVTAEFMPVIVTP